MDGLSVAEHLAITIEIRRFKEITIEVHFDEDFPYINPSKGQSIDIVSGLPKTSTFIKASILNFLADKLQKLQDINEFLLKKQKD